MRKKITLLLAIVTSVSMAFAEIYSGTCGENVTWSLNTEDGTLTISGTGAMNDYYHSEYTTFEETIPWYTMRSFIRTIVINEGVTNIGINAFTCGYNSDSGTDNLTSVSIPGSVVSIGEYAFNGCSALTSIVIPDGVISIGNNAFSNCTGLTSVDIPNSVKNLESYVFANCTGLSSIDIPAGTTNISKMAFYGCSNLNAINVNDSNTQYSTIDGVLFNKDKTILQIYPVGKKEKEYIIPNSVIVIGQYAFYNCKELTSVSIHNSVTCIESYAFDGCSGLTSIAIPNSVTSIGNYAFCSCDGLTSVSIPGSVKNISEKAFLGCSGMTSVEIPNGVVSIEDEAFIGCSNLTSVTIPNSVTSIGREVFEYCPGLVSITIPNSVTTIGVSAFYGIPNIVYYGSATGSPWGALCVNGYKEGYFIYENSSKETLIACDRDAEGEIIIPNSVTSIKEKAFYGCSKITNVTIPNSVTSIGNNAFTDCKSLSVVDGIRYADTYLVEVVDKTASSYTIKAGTRWIQNEAFSGCNQFTSIIIPESVQNIGDRAFSYCSKLSSVVWNAKNCADISYNYSLPFGNNITSFIFGDGVESIPGNLCYGITGVSSISVPSSVTRIGENAFYNVRNVIYEGIATGSPWGAKCVNGYEDGYFLYANSSKETLIACSPDAEGEIVIPNSVTSIKSNAFYYCTGLTSVTIPNGVTSIGDKAFYSCGNLASINIPNSVTSIGSYTFTNCKSLPVVDGIRYADTYLVEVIDKAATSYTIKEGTKWISNDAFSDCNNLTSIIIPQSVQNIGVGAFSYCSGLTSVVWNAKNCADFYSYTCPFRNSTGITSFVFGEKVEYIPAYICSGLTNIQEITIPENVKATGSNPFYHCYGLSSVIWNAKNCEGYASDSYTPFYDIRSQIKSFVLGEDVERIPAYLYYYMSNLFTLHIPRSVTTIGNYAFLNSGLKQLLFACSCEYTLTGNEKVPAKCTVMKGAYTQLPDTTLCYGDELIFDGKKCDLEIRPNNRQICTYTLNTVDGCDSIVEISVLWKQLSRYPEYTIKHEQDYVNSGSISWRFIDCPDYKYDYYTLNGKKDAYTDALPSGEYRLVFYNEQCKDSVVKDITISRLGIKVNGIYYIFNNEDKTAMVTFRGESADYYENEYSGNLIIPDSVKLKGVTYYVNSIHQAAFYHCNKITSITIQGSKLLTVLNNYGYEVGLNINDNIPIYVPFGLMNNYKSGVGFNNLNLHIINPKHVSGTNGATSATITFGDKEEAAHIASCGMVESDTTAGNILEYIGLEPNSEYKDIPFFIITEEGDYDTLHYSLKTEALTLTTKPSKPVSSTTAILLAETNMSDAETSCGFEYKRNDAPADMDGTKVFCPVASGTMAGRLKGLKDDVYYKYRAFYKSAAGNMYYGDWQYIFTGDVAVEFDPVLYTYEAQSVTDRSATLKGYAIAGTEDFTEQGFEYWAESRNSRHAPRRAPKDIIGEKHTVAASGISMRVTLNDLDEGTVYKYRTYAKMGETVVYGSEMQFTTTGEYIEYTVTFKDKDGNTIATRTVRPGNDAEAPDAPNIKGWRFKQWDTDFTDVQSDLVVTAVYEQLVVYTLTLTSADGTMGTVTGSGEYYDGEVVTVEALPKTGYRFVRWSDDNTDNPRKLTITADLTLTAYFEEIPNALDDTQAEKSAPRKMMIDGVLYILMPDGRMYDLQGAEVK